ncbi:unnamed protein product [Spirodela intermedia]|uniref:Sugar phosphate transporter domain-containing protein n=1 Tax=Spirodela intermedia TaxID=51605 RepID=A0A7I8JJL4_SPIIN|nr:unnamed protein product [Spirodela intermedia]CAA6669975.1 unnamed protein product [Spirodela intermedia]
MAAGSKHVLLPLSDPQMRGSGGDESLFKGSAMTKRGAVAAVSYMSCAVLLVLFNKAALSSYNFPCANVITLFQMISSTLILFAMRRWKIISFTAAESRTVSDNHLAGFVSLPTLLHTLPLSLAYLFYMVICSWCECSMYTTLRRTTVVFTIIVEYLLTRQKYSNSVLSSVGLIVFGAFVAGARDMSYDSYGYGVVLLANLTTAIYLATIARIGKSSGLNSFGLMWCNGLICGPVLLLWTYIQGDLTRTMNFPYLNDCGFQAVMLVSCILAFFLNYSIFLNTTLNSALTQTMCGNLKDLFTIGLGWLVFGGLPFDLLNVVGQGLGFFGSGLYAYCKLTGR